MGLHFPRTPGATRGELTASITWCEYMAALSAATDPGGHARRAVDPGRPPLPRLANSVDETGTARLAEQVRRKPEDETAHRRLGLIHLAHGRIEPAAGHLEIALRLVRRHAQRAVGLTDALQRECEAALLRLVLMRLYMRLGDEARARSLAQEAQTVL